MNKTILKAIELSELAYADRGVVMQELLPKAMNLKILDIEDCGVQGFFYETYDTTWVVIRGTEFDSLDDWMTNLDCEFIMSEWGEVHKGFYTDMVAVTLELYDDIQIALARNKQVIFTGHSQGAAVATLLHSDNYYHNTLCIPIESPRCMSKLAAEQYGTVHGRRIYQVINNNDIVPSVPPKAMGYRHVYNTHLRYINRKGKVLHKISGWDKFIDKMFGYVRDFGKIGLDGLKDHSIGTIKELWKNQM